MSVTNRDLALPPSWNLTRLDRVASVNARIGWKALTASEYQHDGVIFLSTPNIKGKAIDFNRVNYIPEWRYEESPELKLRVGDVLLAKDGNTLGITNVVSDLPGPATVNGSIAVLRPRRVEPRFLRYALDSDLCQGMIGALRAGMGVPHLFQWDINRLRLPLPSWRTQRAIADYLEAETARIDTLIAKKQVLADSIELRWLEASRRELVGLHDLADPLSVRGCELSPGWQPLRLGRHLVFGSGTTPTAGDPRFYGPGVPWIVTGDLRDRDLTDVHRSVTKAALEQYSALKVHPADSLVVAMYGATVGRLGISTRPAAVNQACCVIQARDAIDLQFLFFYLLVFRTVLLERTVGAGQPNVSQEILRSLRIAAPDLRAQHTIAERVSRMRKSSDDVARRLRRQVELLGEHRQALITAAVTGELDIPGAA